MSVRWRGEDHAYLVVKTDVTWDASVLFTNLPVAIQQSSPVRTRAIDAVCRQLNDYQARFPGSNRIIRFETDRETEGRN